MALPLLGSMRGYRLKMRKTNDRREGLDDGEGLGWETSGLVASVHRTSFSDKRRQFTDPAACRAQLVSSSRVTEKAKGGRPTETPRADRGVFQDPHRSRHQLRSVLSMSARNIEVVAVKEL
jgi:hypothetical protein